MTSQIRSRLEYLIPTENILVLLLHSNSILKSSLIVGLRSDLLFIGSPYKLSENCIR